MADTTKQITKNWTLILGLCLLGISVIIPLAGIPLLALFQLSTAATVSVSGALLIGSEVLGVISIAVMGKDGYAFIKEHIRSSLKFVITDRPISRSRYNCGLVLFCLPLIFGWISVYLADVIPYFSDHPIRFAVTGDFMMLVSLLILGGEFWQKIRALFIYNMNVNSSYSSRDS